MLAMMDFIGVQSIFIVALTGTFSGMVLALQTTYALRAFSAEGRVGGLVAATAAAAESPAASPKAKRTRKAKTEAAASPAASAAASASPAKKTLADFFKPQTSASAAPAAANTAPAKPTKTGAAMNAAPAPGGGPGMVWVNTETHVYHKEGTRFYGKTKKGKYVSEADAIKEGDKPAKRE